MTLGGVKRFEVPQRLVRATEDALREAGAKGYERFVLWSGRVDDDLFVVEHIYVPAQRSYKLRRGVCVQVEAGELDRLNRWLFTNHQVLGVQVHAHPQDAYHSDTDDSYPIVTILGGLSIVVPYFCRDEMLGPDTAVFRLTADGWRQESKQIGDALVQVEL